MVVVVLNTALLLLSVVWAAPALGANVNDKQRPLFSFTLSIKSMPVTTLPHTFGPPHLYAGRSRHDVLVYALQGGRVHRVALRVCHVPRRRGQSTEGCLVVDPVPGAPPGHGCAAHLGRERATHPPLDDIPPRVHGLLCDGDRSRRGGEGRRGAFPNIASGNSRLRDGDGPPWPGDVRRQVRHQDEEPVPPNPAVNNVGDI